MRPGFRVAALVEKNEHIITESLNQKAREATSGQPPGLARDSSRRRVRSIAPADELGIALPTADFLDTQSRLPTAAEKCTSLRCTAQVMTLGF